MANHQCQDSITTTIQMLMTFFVQVQVQVQMTKIQQFSPCCSESTRQNLAPLSHHQDWNLKIFCFFVFVQFISYLSLSLLSPRLQVRMCSVTKLRGSLFFFFFLFTKLRGSLLVLSHLFCYQVEGLTCQRGCQRGVRQPATSRIKTFQTFSLHT